MITVEIPRAWLLTSNHRWHWREKARRVATLRQMAAARARQANLGTLNGRQRCLVTVAWPDRRIRDVANVYPTVKACVDGIVTDAHLLPNDSDRHMVGPDLRSSDTLCDKRWAAVLTFRFEETP